MPRNGSGTFTLSQAPFVPGTTISSTAVNSDLSDIAAALTQSVATDGQSVIVGPFQFPPGNPNTPTVTFNSDTGTGLYSPGAGVLGIAAGGDAAVIIDSTVEDTGNGNILQYGNGAFINPVGSVIDFAGSTAPTGWFLCYGEPISRANYPELFLVIGTTYGPGDGTSTFNLPDLRGRSTYGKDNMGGTTAGRITSAGTNFDGTLLGNAGGGQDQILAQANLPTVNFALTATFSSGTASITAAQWTHSHTVTASGGASGGLYQNAVGLGNSSLTTSSVSNPTLTGTAAGTVTGHAASGGTDLPFSTLSPALILNKIIFAGRP